MEHAVAFIILMISLASGIFIARTFLARYKHKWGSLLDLIIGIVLALLDYGVILFVFKEMAHM